MAEPLAHHPFCTLQANLVKPDGAEIPLSLITTHVKGSTLPNYELKTDTSMAGEHAVHMGGSNAARIAALRDAVAARLNS